MKYLFMLSLLLCAGLLIGTDDLQFNDQHKGIGTPYYMCRTVNPETNRDISFNVVTPPTVLMFSYWDYFPGNYRGILGKKQIAPGGGTYFIYQAMETNQAASRKCYYSYLNNDNQLSSGRVNLTEIRQGYPSLVIDPVSNDPLVFWHGQGSGSKLSVFMNYDRFSDYNAPGLWSSMEMIIGNGNGPDEFIWPSAFIGASPMGPDFRRLYVFGHNATAGAASSPSENVKLAYTDYNETVFQDISEFNWTIRTIPQLDDYHNCVEYRRPSMSFFVGESGLIGCIGYVAGDSIYSGVHMVTLINENYGEGDFELFSANEFELGTNVSNPMNFFNTTEQMYFAPTNTSYTNAIVNQDKVLLTQAWALSTSGGYYWSFTYVKNLQFDLVTHEFKLLDIYPKGSDPAMEDDGLIYLPWDENGDGEIDTVNEDPNNPGNPIPSIVTGWPYYFWDYNDAYHENNFRIVGSNTNPNIMATVWQSSLRSKNYHEYNDLDYQAWANVPEVYLEFTVDGGDHWSQPVILNSIDTPEVFNNVIPEYIYPCDPIEMVNDSTARVTFMFSDDNDYGSFIMSNGTNVGADISYMILDFNLGAMKLSENDVESQHLGTSLNLSNYPNPFNPQTTISFDLPVPGKADLQIYNVKGQLVKTYAREFSERGRQTFIWDGKSEFGAESSSGIYFYRVSSGKLSQTGKMMLIK